ncbi:helix-turn-helix domain-containing protein [Geodermatophilus tzadiensis]|uniref:AraC-like ligand-binding domain-containing protein n=1 Tax=Geodermatophilus tzadiensis TaxID=1137988 RepID=UPI001B80DBA8|nr:helix-turn-helix domain-containing protein [Geodermatophilus tzadiensis]
MTRLEAWREVLAQTFVPLEATPLGEEAAFHGRVQAAPVADLQLSIVSGSGQVVRRTRRLVEHAAADLYKVGVQLRGRGLVEQDGRVAELAPGDLAVYDTARPYELVFERDFEMLVLVVPRRRLVSRAPGLDGLTAVTISGARGSGALTSSLLRGLDPRTARQGAEAVYLSDAAVDLVAACLAGCSDSRGAAPGADAVVLAARRYIEDHLADPALSPAEVATAVHMSLRHLQKLFERRGSTITGGIRELRLERCWHDLADPRLAHRPVAAVAASWGLVDAAQFSRAFRARYGTTPRAHRADLTARDG